MYTVDIIPMSGFPDIFSRLNAHDRNRGRFCAVCVKYLTRKQYRDISYKRPTFLPDNPEVLHKLMGKFPEYNINDIMQPSTLCASCRRRVRAQHQRPCHVIATAQKRVADYEINRTVRVCAAVCNPATCRICCCARESVKLANEDKRQPPPSEILSRTRKRVAIRKKRN